MIMRYFRKEVDNHEFCCPCCGNAVDKEYIYDMSMAYYCVVNRMAKIQGISPLEDNDNIEGVCYNRLCVDREYRYSLSDVKCYLQELEEKLKSNSEVNGAERVKKLSTTLRSKGLSKIRMELIQEDETEVLFRILSKQENQEFRQKKRCPNCYEEVAQTSGKYPQVIISILGSKNSDIKGFIIAAISKIKQYDNRLEVINVSEKGLNTIHVDLDYEFGMWDYNAMEKIYNEYLNNEDYKFPEFESPDPYDNELFHSYIFLVRNKDTGNAILLNIIEYNKYSLEKSYLEIEKTSSIIRSSEYVLFLLNANDIKDDKTVAAVRDYTNEIKKAAISGEPTYGLICEKDDEGVLESIREQNNKCCFDRMLDRLKNNRNKYFDEQIIDIFNFKRAGYFVCSPHSRQDRRESERHVINCEEVLYWILVLEGICSVRVKVDNHYSDVIKSRCNKRKWRDIEKYLTLLYERGT